MIHITWYLTEFWRVHMGEVLEITETEPSADVLRFGSDAWNVDHLPRPAYGGCKMCIFSPGNQATESFCPQKAQEGRNPNSSWPWRVVSTTADSRL